MSKGYRKIYLNKRFFGALFTLVLLFALGYPFPWMYNLAKITLLILSILLVTDILWLRFSKGTIDIRRNAPARFSMGDDNPMSVTLSNTFPYKIHYELIEELPFQFQKRDFSLKGDLRAGQHITRDYLLKPLSRGAYHFGQSNVYVTGSIKLISLRIKANNEQVIPVYPSFISMRQFELMSISNRLEELGIKRIRRLGQHSDFDQIREYVPGDDSRIVNWKATARKASLMVNQYQDERSQQVISLIDMGRVMEMPFNGMSLLDYAINASLVISNIAMLKHDRAGLITFSKQIHSLLPAERRGGHLQRIMDVLYNQQTNFMESSYEALYATVTAKIKQRSLLILYTNFEGLPSWRRQLPYLKKLAAKHLLLVVFFENTEIGQIVNRRSTCIEEVYINTIARKFMHDKKVIVNELKRAGILALLSPPEGLSVNLINKYLEIKARELI
ncbi:DUF58 domain-containing protein [Mangrovibacterium marinum]|uniref:Uncharacterized protein (DUF58 family) n=1 Tax=Mangrovibacterium marinum TaxID=1639118 RepID=A0A2T5BZ91_9BACT|nr:DUF58 domain-containing protein [Mangrovibacterium marinum]PTN07589.1 uncharacterized protein (DUF58 family) [Mangrovibacterium marinum]